jgi:hypothetical protein
MVALSCLSVLRSACGGSFGCLGFGRARSARVWVLVGVPPVCAAHVGALLLSAGCSALVQGCSVSSRLVWFAFAAPPAVVAVLSALPVPPGSRPFAVAGSGRLLFGAAAASVRRAAA